LNCKGVIRELSNYIDGDLDPGLKTELERHLEHCEDCTMIVDQTKKSIEILCDSRPVELPSDVRSRLHAALRQKIGPGQT
jgi:anti-sigma factor RsiW